MPLTPFDLIPDGASWIVLTQGMRGLPGSASLGQNLTDLANLTIVADTVLGFNGSKAMTLFSATTYGRSLISSVNAAAARILVDAQQSNVNLVGIAGLTSAADRVAYFTGTGGASALTTLTSFGRSMIGGANAAAVQTTLGLGTMATQNASGITIVNMTFTGTLTGSKCFITTLGVFQLNGGTLISGVADVNGNWSIPSTGDAMFTSLTQKSGGFNIDASGAGTFTGLSVFGSVQFDSSFISSDGSGNLTAASYTGAYRADSMSSGSGTIPTDCLPSLAITEFLGTAADEPAMLAFTGQQGDWCIRADLGTNWVIIGSDPTLLSDWQELTYPTAPVTSVNGFTGTVSITTITGNSGTATILQTTRTIGGSNFNGSGNVTSFPVPGVIGATTPSSATFTTVVIGSATSLLLGTAGTAVGSIGFRNASSGTATLAPPTGALGTYQVTMPNAASTLPIFGQQITFTGPTAARSVLLPDAAFSVARIDAAQTFVGVHTFTGGLISRNGGWTNNSVIGSGSTGNNAGNVFGDGGTAGVASIALGNNTTAGDQACAIGHAATANGTGRIAIGYVSTSAGDNATSIGRNTTATYGVVIGYRITDLAIGDTALGGRTDASAGVCRTLFYSVNTFANERVAGCVIANFDVTTDAVREGSLAFQAWYSNVPTAYECIKIRAGSSGAMIGVYGATPVYKPTVTGSRGGNAALASLLTQLASIGWVTDSSS